MSSGRPDAVLRAQPYSWAEAHELSEGLGLAEPVAIALVRRGYRTVEEARGFLSAEDSHDPLELAGVEDAVELLLAAARAGRRITVHGDYDVDGVCATAIAVGALREAGAECDWVIPDRLADGYGLSPATIERLTARGTDVLLTVDCGIASAEEIALAHEAGIEVVVSDHHEPPERLPECTILHPRLGGYPCPDLCGAGVAFKLAQALRRAAGLRGEDADVDLVALATVADMVPLRGENRALVRRGLRSLRRAARPGVRALLAAARVEPERLDEGDLAFRIAPRINAAGRLYRADAGVELMLTDDDQRAAAIAAELDAANRERREAEAATLAGAEAALRELPEGAAELPAIVLAGEGWHPGVVGIVASRLVELHWRPVVLISLDEHGRGRGSGRGIPGFDLLAALQGCAGHLTRFGGHRAAAGLEIEAAGVDAFRTAFLARAAEQLDLAQLTRPEPVDAVVGGDSLGAEVADQLELMAPFGIGNPNVRLLVPAARIRDVRPMGEDGAHARFAIEAGAGRAMGVAFGVNGELAAAQREPHDLSVRLELNHWNGSEHPRAVLGEVHRIAAATPDPDPDLADGDGDGDGDGAQGCRTPAAAEEWWRRFDAELERDLAALAEGAEEASGLERRVLDCRGGSLVARIAELVSSGAAVLAVCADAERRRGLAATVADPRRFGVTRPPWHACGAAPRRAGARRGRGPRRPRARRLGDAGARPGAGRELRARRPRRPGAVRRARAARAGRDRLRAPRLGRVRGGALASGPRRRVGAAGRAGARVPVASRRLERGPLAGEALRARSAARAGSRSQRSARRDACGCSTSSGSSNGGRGRWPRPRRRILAGDEPREIERLQRIPRPPRGGSAIPGRENTETVDGAPAAGGAHAAAATTDVGGDRRGHTRVGEIDGAASPAPLDSITRSLGDPDRKLLGDLFAVIEEHSARKTADVDREAVEAAFAFACERHADQRRRSGEEFINHPTEVAKICAGLRLDTETLCAALLHDTVEDTSASLDDVRERFGDEVAQLVDGVTKLTGITFQSRDESQAENYRKMMVAMATDVRVILIKLADRLHNMRTIDALSKQKQIEKARETLEIYAPLAHRLGIHAIKWELEDLAFQRLHPRKYDEIKKLVSQQRTERERYVEEAGEFLRDELAEVGIEAEISGRAKHFYSIYSKMSKKGREFNEIYDLTAMRVIVGSVKDCYGAIGIIHSIWKPLPGRFKDFIATPRLNLYQALHTTVIGPEGRPLEIQIRTPEMHETAEYGIAAHVIYKEGAGSKRDPQREKMTWLRQLLEAEGEQNPEEFLESLKIDLFEDEVFVFTPRGEVKNLSAGSTPLDFAYAVHTDVGHRCVGAKVNGKIVPLHYQLRSGDIVEILTSKRERGPSRDWLGLVRTSRARNKIRASLKRERREDAERRGREELQALLRKRGLPPQKIAGSPLLADVIREMGFSRADDFYIALGQGKFAAKPIANKLLQRLKAGESVAGDEGTSGLAGVLEGRDERPRRIQDASNFGILVDGVDDVMVRLAKCCRPVPGDEIVGYVSLGRGITIHRDDCKNVEALRKDPERFTEVSWDGDNESSYRVELQVDAWDRTRLLEDLSRTFSEAGINILEAKCTTKHPMVRNRFVVEVGDTGQLKQCVTRLRQVESVFDAYRVTPGE